MERVHIPATPESPRYERDPGRITLRPSVSPAPPYLGNLSRIAQESYFHRITPEIRNTETNIF